MADWDDTEEKSPIDEGNSTEAIRIIGASEAGEMVSQGDKGNFGADSYPEEGQGSDEDYSSPSDMPHWTEPATGEVPVVLASMSSEQPSGEDENPWESSVSSLTKRSLSWRDSGDDWDDDDFQHSMLADDDSRLGALNEDDVESANGFFDDDPLGSEPEPEQPRTLKIGSGIPYRNRSGLGSRQSGAEGDVRRSGRRQGRVDRGSGDDGGRNLGAAIATGVGIGIVVIVLFLMGSASALFVVTVAVMLGVAEFYAVVRKAGFHPASLLGLVGTLCLMIGAYAKGEPAVPVVMGLVTVFTLIWFLWGVTNARPALNAAMTLLAFLWVGFLGSFTALLLSPKLFPNRHGVVLLFGAIVATVGHDVFAFMIGSRFGKHQLAPDISPGKTWEGLIGGMSGAILVSLVVASQVSPWTMTSAFELGVVVAIMAPLGDLCESMVKRDLGIKDMGSLLPGHGGILDRIDAMLFVMPAVFFLAKLLKIA